MKQDKKLRKKKIKELRQQEKLLRQQIREAQASGDTAREASLKEQLRLVQEQEREYFKARNERSDKRTHRSSVRRHQIRSHEQARERKHAKRISKERRHRERRQLARKKKKRKLMYKEEKDKREGLSEYEEKGGDGQKDAGASEERTTDREGNAEIL